MKTERRWSCRSRTTRTTTWDAILGPGSAMLRTSGKKRGYCERVPVTDTRHVRIASRECAAGERRSRLPDYEISAEVWTVAHDDTHFDELLKLESLMLRGCRPKLNDRPSPRIKAHRRPPACREKAAHSTRHSKICLAVRRDPPRFGHASRPCVMS